MALPDVVEEVRPAIVQITYTVFGLPGEELMDIGAPGPAISKPLGTGLFVNDDAYVLTAAHVIDAAQNLPAQFPRAEELHLGVGLAYPNSDNMRGNFHVVSFEVEEIDTRHDIALLKMRRNPFAGEAPGGIVKKGEPILPLFGVPRMRLDRPRDGEAIAVSGYPLSEPVLVTNAGIMASSWSVALDQVPDPSQPASTIPDLRDLYLADVQTNPGNSGGPVYSAHDGSIIGILIAGKLTSVIAGGEPVMANGLPVLADAGLSVVVPIRYALEMLDRRGVHWIS